MILNLPKKFPISKLEDFTFGGVDAQTDRLLEAKLCVCNISPIISFLNNDKSLLVGESGTGKTAVFKLISRGALNFKNEDSHRQVLISIDEKLLYATIKDQIQKIVSREITDESLKFRIVWEIYIIYRILLKLKELFLKELPPTLIKAISDLEAILDNRQKNFSIFEILSSIKHTVGCKIDHVGNVPNLYYSFQKTDNENSNKKEQEQVIFKIDFYKKEVQKFLVESRTILFVLIDKLDEFVIKEEYEIQKEMLQALLFTERDYLELNNIKLKIFLRADLFNKLDFEELGYDKVLSRMVELKWTDSDIRNLIARRIAYNLYKILDLKIFKIEINEENLFIDRESSEYESLAQNRGFFDHILKFIKTKIRKIRKRDLRNARRTSFNDEINEMFITSVFPRQVIHKAIGGKKDKIKFLTFLNSHFNLSTAYTTPRLIILYLEKCMSLTRLYYRENPDIELELDSNNEFPLIKIEFIAEAYFDLQNEIWGIFSKNCSSKWRIWFETFRKKRENKFSFNYNHLKKIISPEDEKDFREFLAFLSHLGLINCTNTSPDYSERRYLLPIIFRT